MRDINNRVLQGLSLSIQKHCNDCQRDLNCIRYYLRILMFTVHWEVSSTKLVASGGFIVTTISQLMAQKGQRTAVTQY